MIRYMGHGLKLPYSGILTVLGVAVSLLCAFFFRISPEASHVGDILQYTFWLWLLHWSFALVGLGLVLLTRGPRSGSFCRYSPAAG